MKEEYKRVMIAGILLVIAIIMTVVSWMILPDAISTQFPGLTTGVPLMPKWIAILFASGLSIAFAVLSVKTEEALKYTLIGYGLHVLYWICNI